MKNARLDVRLATASVLLGFGFVLGLGLVAGCANEGVIAPESTWDEIRYHWSDQQNGSTHGDLTVQSSGQIGWDLQGAGAPTRGLLAGENLETLTRLIDALPPAGYDGLESCDRRFFVAMRTTDGIVHYRAGDCDPFIPESVMDLIHQLDVWVADAAGRVDPIPFRILAQGRSGGLESEARMVARSRDELIALVSNVRDEGVGVLPSVDFRREIVLAIFPGTHPGEGHAVELLGARMTAGGQVLLSERWTIVDPACSGGTSSAPYQFVAIELDGYANLLSEVEIVSIRPCDPSGGSGTAR